MILNMPNSNNPMDIQNPTEKDLKKYYETNVKPKRLFRVVSKEYLADIKRSGIDPKKNPFNELKPKFSKLFKLAYELEKIGVIFKHMWGEEEVGLDRMIGVTQRDLETAGVDFTSLPRMEEYYKKRRGGALATTISFLTETMVNRTKVKLTPQQKRLVDGLKEWANERKKFESITIQIDPTCPSLENAEFKYSNTDPKTKKYKSAPSPFGSFESFKNAVSEKGLVFYDPYLRGDKLGHFELRVKDKVGPKYLKAEV